MMSIILTLVSLSIPVLIQHQMFSNVLDIAHKGLRRLLSLASAAGRERIVKLSRSNITSQPEI